MAKPGSTLSVGDISVKILRMTWQKDVGISQPIPGTKIYAAVSLRITNNGAKAGTVTPTQFWMLDALHREYVASLKTDVPNPLIGKTVKPGQSVNGTVVYGTPRKLAAGAILVYQFKDAKTIAKAIDIGLLQFR